MKLLLYEKKAFLFGKSLNNLNQFNKARIVINFIFVVDGIDVVVVVGGLVVVVVVVVVVGVVVVVVGVVVVVVGIVVVVVDVVVVVVGTNNVFLTYKSMESIIKKIFNINIKLLN